MKPWIHRGVATVATVAAVAGLAALGVGGGMLLAD